MESFLRSGDAKADGMLLDQLEAAGVPYRLEGESVRLQEELELLSADAILKQAGDWCDEQSLLIYRTVDSTNEAAMQQLTALGDVVCVAETQSAGKGRRGRSWVSPFGRNIYLTIAKRLHCDMGDLEGLSLVIGMAAAEVLRQMGVDGVGLKWPNDLLLDGGKLGGILVELRPPELGRVGVIMGVGINLAISDADAEAIDQSWSQIDGKLKVSRNELTGRLINQISAAVQRFEETGFHEFAGLWREYNAYDGQRVRIMRGDEVIEGIDSGVDASGNLLLLNEMGLTSHNAGEVSLRPAELL